jgi:FkbM family methyltransferase
MGLRRFFRKRGWELIAKVEDPQLRVLKYLKKFRENPQQNEEGEADFFNFCLAHYSKSNSENYQDLFVLWQLKQKKSGLFVEFGATDGMYGSNSLLLEQEGWRGLLSEPARCWHNRLKANRPNTVIDLRCVWVESGKQLEFTECEAEGLSTIASFAEQDQHALVRKQSINYTVDTVSFNNLLDQNGIGSIDYLSIDTEGSEFDILKAWNPEKHPISIITVEHNYVESKRKAIEDLLLARGYTPKFRKFSLFDDWYVNKSSL